MRHLLVIVWLASSATVLAQAPADEAGAAQPTASATESARTHFKLGVDFYRERNFRAALIEFKRAYTDAPHYKLLYNLGQASLELQEYGNAIDYFTDYLKQGGEEITAERRQEVEESMRYLESRMGQVRIASNRPGAELYVDDTLVGRVPLDAPVRVGAGRHRFAAIEQGLPAVERVIDVAAGDATEVTLDFEERPAVAAPAPEPSPAADYVFEDESSNGAAIALGVTTAVLGAGAITLTVLTAVAQKDYRDELDTLTEAARLDELRDDAKTKALVTDILWGATLVSGIVTTVLIVTGGGDDAPSDERPAHALRVGVSPTGASVSGRF